MIDVASLDVESHTSQNTVARGTVVGFGYCLLPLLVWLPALVGLL